ncbi:hypothetical protein Lalb_Chr08g0237191 [Lupinus albus]|uniref:Uncharacterized protein n=1 Tax=Lupinus albus TaxID=3870 RepID=A0A6A4Q3Z3_LUPAL|nr:hypothetical protein Lalb_Chr08g0237191 [Lupinus albus]
MLINLVLFKKMQITNLLDINQVGDYGGFHFSESDLWANFLRN